MRIILDVNVLISALATSNPRSPARKIIKAVYLQRFSLLLPTELLDEFILALTKRKYRRIQKLITVEQAERMISLLVKVAEPIAPIREKIPALSRDPKDDYLPAYAKIGRADYLVTGDNDLLVLKQVGSVTIVNPRTFVAILLRKRKGKHPQE